MGTHNFRVSDDAINSMATGTVKTHVGHINTIVKNCQEINRTPHLPPWGPMPLGDPVGMGSAAD